VLGEALQEWLLARLPRHPAALREAAARLDRQALAAGGRVTRAMAAALLAKIGDGSCDDSDNSVKEVSTNERVLL
jgi:hypothetical protein